MEKAKLFLVGTPIGNKKDISQRAIEVLQNVAVIFCENMRKSRLFFQELDIHSKTLSFRQNTDAAVIIEYLQAGKDVALVSDAGMPSISDPGARLAGEIKNKGYDIVPIAGPSAFLLALVGSGLPTNHFEFFGFIPHKKGRQKFYDNLISKNHSCIFYESCHRIMKCLQELEEKMPTRIIVIAKEISKINENFLSGTASQLLIKFEQNTKLQKGEFVVLVAGKNFK